ncbi:MAG: glycosyltransferase, partial [Mycoplasma sp.]|nr:glycosyltransferase [Mycoplasma sp.]
NLEYAKSKVFVLTSRWESFCLSLVEAIGNGCAIVSTEMSSSRDMTNCGEFGRLFSSNDGEQLASILNGIINGSIIFPDEEEIKKFAKKHFSWKGIAKKLNGYLN